MPPPVLDTKRLSPAALLIIMKALGVWDVCEMWEMLLLKLMSFETAVVLMHGLERTYAPGALDNGEDLTALGQEMVYCSTDTHVSRLQM